MSLLYFLIATVAAIISFVRGDVWMGIALFGIASINVVGMNVAYIANKLEPPLTALSKSYKDKILADKTIAAVIKAAKKDEVDDGK